MKALVLEIQNGTAAVLKEDGSVEKIRRKCRVGETIDLDDNVRSISAARLRWIYTAAAVLAIVIFGSVHAYYTAYACSYVSLDINPSIEYSLNRRDRVIAVEALNSDAEAVVSELESEGYKNRSLPDVMDETLDILYNMGYLGDGEDYVLAAVTSESDESVTALTDEINSSIGTGRDGNLQLYVVTVPTEDRQLAQDQGISAGRYAAIKQIAAGDAAAGTGAGSTPPEISSDDIEKYKDAPVSDLLREAGKTDAGGDLPMQGGTAPSQDRQPAQSGDTGAQAPSNTGTPTGGSSGSGETPSNGSAATPAPDGSSDAGNSDPGGAATPQTPSEPAQRSGGQQNYSFAPQNGQTQPSSPADGTVSGDSVEYAVSVTAV